MRTAPAAAFRGLANGSSPSFARSSFKRSWSRLKMSTSPRRVTRPLYAIVIGTPRMVRALAVMSSPVSPSPHVLLQLVFAVRVVEREHPHGVLHFGSPRARLAGDALRRRLRRDQLGVC